MCVHWRNRVPLQIVRLLDICVPPEGQPINDLYLVMELMPMDLHRIIRCEYVLTDPHVAVLIYQRKRVSGSVVRSAVTFVVQFATH